jgi:hypothetical protein
MSKFSLKRKMIRRPKKRKRKKKEGSNMSSV